MPSGDSKWTDLASQNERVVQLGDPAAGSASAVSTAAQMQWAELASQSERLADHSDPMFPLASSGHATSGMRLVASAA